MSIKNKERLVSLLRVFNYVGLIVLLFVTFQILAQIREQSIANHDDTAKAVQQIQKDHDRQNRYLQCLVNIFINSSRDEVTQEQSAECLSAVRTGTTETTVIQPTDRNGQTTTTTTTNQTSPAMSQDRPQTTLPAEQPKTSGPPDPETASPFEKIIDLPGDTIDALTREIRGIL